MDGTQSIMKPKPDMVEGHHASKKGVHCCIVLQEELVGLIDCGSMSKPYVTNIGYWLVPMQLDGVDDPCCANTVSICV